MCNTRTDILNFTTKFLIGSIQFVATPMTMTPRIDSILHSLANLYGQKLTHRQRHRHSHANAQTITNPGCPKHEFPMLCA